ncbi:MAG: anthranilate phosphoribosyltransferase [Acidobacteria bacterium]|nr:anthranilate phosphoribosyltransferase [Acidobacteriota bacterium]
MLRAIFDQQFSDVQIGALLIALAAKGESIEEIVGFARGMRRFAVALNHNQERLVDTAGTGGDASGTFNISTAAAFVIAGAGVPVAKHGNRAMSGKCGSADVLGRLGVNIEAPKGVLEDCLASCGITFLFAPLFHPAMKAVGKVRRELGVRTIFNLLGPLLNPAGARRQIIGVFSLPLTETLAEALRQLQSERALIFSGEDGLDEISLEARTQVTELRDGTLQTRFVEPEDFGLARRSRAEIRGDDAEQNARILRDILENRSSEAQRDIVLLNAAAGIYVAGAAQSVEEGMKLARASLFSGQALTKLELLVKLSNHSLAETTL